jgi:3-oxoacyl-[acyl-carrier protein] reductase
MSGRRVVLVTGGTGDIGRELCFAMARRGQRVAVGYTTSDSAAEAVVAECRKVGGLGENDVAAFKADIAVPSECEGLLKRVVDRFGRIDVLINNAAVAVDVDDPLALDFSEFQQHFERSMALNSTAAVNLTFLTSKLFRKQERLEGLPDTNERGRVVNVSSRAAHCGDVSAPWYAGSKASMVKFTQSLAKPYAPEGLYFFTVAPGAVEGRMWESLTTPENLDKMRKNHPLGRLGLPSEVAKACEFAALDAPALMTGAIIDLNQAFYVR